MSELPKYAPSAHAKTEEPKVAMRRIRLKAEALAELRKTIRAYIDENEEVMTSFFRMLREHDKVASEIRNAAKALHTADFDDSVIEVGDFKLTKMPPQEKWNVSKIYRNGDDGAFFVEGIVKEINGDVVVSAVHNHTLPPRFLKYRERREHPDFRVTGPNTITPKV